MAASSGERSASGSGVGCAGGDESACSTPFVSAPSSPARDPSFSAAGGFYSAPASPARGVPGTAADEYGCEMALDFDFEFSSRCPSPAAAAMSSADELFHNGQIRPMRLASFLLRPQALPPLDGDVTADNHPQPEAPSELAPAEADERGRLPSRSVRHRRYRSLSPFRAHWLSPSLPPAPATKPVESAAEAGEAAPSASRSSSSSSTASSASSSSSSSSRNYYRRWGFLKDILHRSTSDGGGERPPLPSDPSPKRNPSPSTAATSRGRGRARRSAAHARLYEARRAEAEVMRRRTFLPYRQGLLLGCLGLGTRGYGAMHSLAAAAGKARS